MKGKTLIAAALLTLSVHAPAAMASQRAAVSASPKVVAPGAQVTIRVAARLGRPCTLSIQRSGRVSYRRKVRASRVTVAVPSASAPGARAVVVRCGRRVARARFSVAAPAAPPTPAPVNPPAPPQPVQDEQGFVAGTSGAQAAAPPDGQRGGGPYDNARIADIGLSKLGQNLFTPGWLDHGQCKQAVNDWVAEASGHTQVMGGDYYGNYARNGGTQVSRDDAVKGDIIQLDNPQDSSNYYSGMHTAVVVGHAAGSDSFDVVDSNWKLDDTVRRHAWDPYASGRRYGLRVTIWRMGTVTPPPAQTPPPSQNPPPSQTPPPTQPAPAPHAETTGGVAHTWTNYTNAGGTEGPTIGANATVLIACKVQGFRVQDGNTWWYRIASGPWNGQYYVSADAFYNNGQTSGSLIGTPFVDPAVPDC